MYKEWHSYFTNYCVFDHVWNVNYTCTKRQPFKLWSYRQNIWHLYSFDDNVILNRKCSFMNRSLCVFVCKSFRVCSIHWQWKRRGFLKKGMHQSLFLKKRNNTIVNANFSLEYHLWKLILKVDDSQILYLILI